MTPLYLENGKRHRQNFKKEHKEKIFINIGCKINKKQKTQFLTCCGLLFLFKPKNIHLVVDHLTSIPINSQYTDIDSRHKVMTVPHMTLGELKKRQSIQSRYSNKMQNNKYHTVGAVPKIQ